MTVLENKTGSQGTFNGITINTDLFDSKNDSDPAIINTEDEAKTGAEEKPLIIAFSQTDTCREELNKVKSHYRVILLNDKDGFKSLSQANKTQNPIFIIDVGENCCKKEVIEIAKWTKENFPSSIRIATGEILAETGKLRYHNENACDLVKVYTELSSFLVQRRELQTKKKGGEVLN